MSTLKAARADNFYFPSDQGPQPTKQKNKHPGAENGVIVVRYETPYHVKCLKCFNMIAKGVRFNAQKKCIGKYLTTKIWEFKMNCPSCGNKIVSNTDPEHTQFNYVEGAKQWMDTSTATNATTDFIPDAKDKQRMAQDAFYNLETVVDDERKAEEYKPMLQKLEEINDEKYKFDFENNLMLRRKFKTEKKILIEQEKLRNQPKNFGLLLVTPQIDDLIETNKIKNSMSNKYKLNQIKRREDIRTESIFEKNQKSEELTILQRKLSKLPKSTQKQLKLQIKQQNIIKNQLGTLNRN